MQVKLEQLENDVQWQVLARGPNSSPAADVETLRDYFNLHEPLASMSKEWAATDPRFKLISPYFPGTAPLQDISSFPVIHLSTR